MLTQTMTMLVGLTLAMTVAASPEDPYRRGPEERRWEPVRDTVYLQESGQQIATEQPILTAAVYEGTVYLSTGDGVYELDGNRLHRIPEAPAGIHRLRVLNGALWGVSSNGLYRYYQDALTKLSDDPFVDVCVVGGVVHAATRDHVYRYEDGALVNVEPEMGFRSTNITMHLEDGTHITRQREDGKVVRWRPERIGPVARIASYSDTLYVMHPNGLALLDNETVDPRVVEWGLPPSKTFRDMLSLGNRLLIATDKGVAVLRGMALTTLDGKAGLPYEDTTCLAEGFARDLWIGTTWGAVRKVNDSEFHYFAGQRWLPENKVNDIAVGDNAVYIATDGGLGVIRYEPYTLQKKAAYYERRMEEWGHKRMGFTHPIFKTADDEWIREITDNDGGFSAHYLVAMMYKYAVTGDEQAWEEAVNTFKALIWLEEITPIPGFPARSIWSVHGDAGTKSEDGSGGLPARWVPTPDGNFAWKGDTSSDEIGAHYYAMSVFYQLAPDGPEKERAKEHIDRLTRHIIENGWKLRDMGGELTRWGRWDPEYLQRPYGMYARGLNGMEAQAYAHTALGMFRNDYYRNALQQLLDWRYHEHTVRQKITFPPDYITIWDDRLAFMCYYPLVKYAEQEWLRALYLRSLERSWEIKRIEKHPWFNFLYGAITGNECEAEKGVQFLREWPLDMISYTYQNSHRADLYPEPGYVPYAVGPRTDSPKAISPRESEPKKLDGTELSLDGGSGGRRSITPNTWLESYWMGRYFGFITAPDTDDPALLTIEDRPLEQR
ncbi:MAG TPA: hypothetical protein ENN65_08365, partial [Candidatus Hydrogenedentes bacterium]|nr:hypothetical protein [Candidatus Hydrogenedentota bacterium]